MRFCHGNPSPREVNCSYFTKNTNRRKSRAWVGTLWSVEQSGRYTTITITSAKWKAWLDRYGDAPPNGPSR
jgi:hypothetical protein